MTDLKKLARDLRELKAKHLSALKDGDDCEADYALEDMQNLINQNFDAILVALEEE